MQYSRMKLYSASGTVKNLTFPVFCSTMERRYLSPSLTISASRSFNISLMRKPRFASSMRAVAMRVFGRAPQNPSFMVWMISLYCSGVSAMVFMFTVFTPFYELWISQKRTIPCSPGNPLK